MTSAADMGLDGLDGRHFALWASGFTRRWHMNAAMSCFDDYICGHQGRCGQLVISLYPDHTIELLRAAVVHDAANFDNLLKRVTEAAQVHFGGGT